MSARIRAFSCGGLVLVGALSLTGCYARARVEPAYVETTYVPAHVHTYPSHYYEGRTVYLIDNRWYYRRPNGVWVYYRNEPPVLYRQRMSVRRAPPAPASPGMRPAYREAEPQRARPAYDRDDGRRGDPPQRKKRRHGDRDRDDRDRDRDRDDRRHDDRNHDRDRGHY
jgi:hypothetical protein